eukprot:2445448-Prymnesium_polylepis.2
MAWGLGGAEPEDAPRDFPDRCPAPTDVLWDGDGLRGLVAVIAGCGSDALVTRQASHVCGENARCMSLERNKA